MQERTPVLVSLVKSSDHEASISLTRHGARQTVSASLGDMPKIMRLREPGRSFNWNGSPGGRWGAPDARNRQRIKVDGDEMSPQMNQELRDELNQLRDELRQMREELNRRDRDGSSDEDKTKDED